MQHSMRKYNVGDRMIFVLDNVFDEQFIHMIYHFMSHLPFTLSEYDTEETRHAPHWKYEFNLRSLPPIPLIPELVSRSVAITNDLYSKSQLKLNRMHCNV